MCGCEVCVQAKWLQRILNARWCIISRDNKSYKRIGFPNDNTLHNEAKDTTEETMYPYISLGKKL